MADEDRTVQVPVSLIERIAASSIENPDEDALIELSALLSQPTPAAEHDDECLAGEWNEAAGVTCVCICGAEPPRIEDMAPDAASKLEAVRGLARKARWGCERWADPLPVPQYVLDLEAILDPSTIRDVTPPKENPHD